MENLFHLHNGNPMMGIPDVNLVGLVVVENTISKTVLCFMGDGGGKMCFVVVAKKFGLENCFSRLFVVRWIALPMENMPEKPCQ